MKSPRAAGHTLLGLQHLMQTLLGLGIQRLDKPKALERGRSVLFILLKAQDTLADNDLKFMLLVNPIAQVPPVNTHCEGALRQRQKIPIARLTLDTTRLFLTQLRFQPLRHLEGVGIVSKPVQNLVGRLTLFQGSSQVLSRRKTT